MVAICTALIPPHASPEFLKPITNDGDCNGGNTSKDIVSVVAPPFSTSRRLVLAVSVNPFGLENPGGSLTKRHASQT